jgi:hypothetical protein
METELAQDKAKWCDFLNSVMKYAFRIHREFLEHRSSRIAEEILRHGASKK